MAPSMETMLGDLAHERMIQSTYGIVVGRTDLQPPGIFFLEVSPF